MPTLWDGHRQVDIESFFDTLDHEHLRAFLDRRVTDGVLRRGAPSGGEGAGWGVGGSTVRGGAAQGGVISPLLANVYLHEVLDTWFHQEAQPRLLGRTKLIRYADDFVVVCEREDDAGAWSRCAAETTRPLQASPAPR
ncbi:MAG: hypothetical protein IPN77_19970 [Sandaracinaceae bacterium]|nr:hypothetical protein [Sandaracinaceae bacterium]